MSFFAVLCITRVPFMWNFREIRSLWIVELLF
jgi:hypothetical protein